MWPARALRVKPAWWQPDAQLLGLFVLAVELVLIIALAAGISIAHHLLFYGDTGPWWRYAWLGLVSALLFLPLRLMRSARAGDWVALVQTPVPDVLAAWSYTFIVLFLASFLAKETAIWSRASIALFFASGMLMLSGLQLLWRELIARGLRQHVLHLPPAILIGSHESLHAFGQRLRNTTSLEGLRPFVPVTIPADGDESRVQARLRAAAGRARMLHAAEVYLLAPFDRRPLIEQAVDVFLDLPVSLHVGPDPLLEAHPGARLARLGDMLTLELIRPPLSPLARLGKRLFDASAAALGLLALMPLFAVIAIAIKLDSPGPVFFRQRRSGFNGQPFSMWKFRTMRVMEDGEQVRQATVDDPRITRVGAFLRRTSLDELPQLINVLKGEMSLVGPRPHALAHDNIFERKVARYARRYKVLPGITGWAQVNGYRGETDTEEKLRKRVEYDLEYIERASFVFDLYILLLTFFSRRTHHNAV